MRPGGQCPALRAGVVALGEVDAGVLNVLCSELGEAVQKKTFWPPLASNQYEGNLESTRVECTRRAMHEVVLYEAANRVVPQVHKLVPRRGDSDCPSTSRYSEFRTAQVCARDHTTSLPVDSVDSSRPAFLENSRID